MHNGDRFFLLEYADRSAVGLYALAYKLVGAASAFSIGPLWKVWSAQMYEVFALREAPYSVGRAATRILGAYLFGGLALWVFRADVLRLLATPAYLAAGECLGPLVLAYFFCNLATLGDAPFYVKRCTHLKTLIAAVSAAATVGLYAALIPQYGAAGAAYATLGGFIVHAVVTLAVAQRIVRIHYELGRLAAMLSLAMAIAGVAEVVPAGVTSMPIRILLIAAWPFGLWFGGIVSPWEKSQFVFLCRQAMAWLRNMVAWSAEKPPV